ncbi:MAG TPA: hypothetical protein VFJ82_09770 [Longimicrobium sp.]|nr:hypothetical protein [Longimicrobium sp.]
MRTQVRRAAAGSGRWIAAGLFALVLSPTTASAQAPAYRRAPGDTLRYHEVTTGTVEMRPASGAVSVRTRHDARVAVTFGAADTARAWFEALSLSAAGPPLGERRPETAPLLGRPYTFVLGPRGEARTVRLPEIPAEVLRVSDLSAEFTEFFPRLSAGPLAPGATWADTASHQTTNAAGVTVIGRRIGSYRVRGDSTIRGERVVAVEVRTSTEILSGAATPRASGATTQSSLKGEETGVFFFAPAGGRLVERRRTGRLAGSLTVTAGGRTLSIPQSFTYESRVELIR